RISKEVGPSRKIDFCMGFFLDSRTILSRKCYNKRSLTGISGLFLAISTHLFLKKGTIFLKRDKKRRFFLKKG
ncbi:hypothetical protein ACIQX3_13325, partial [Peribacillus frigoritolerans]|uniref:hypothetical protein n=1 Tax=Peribacillus frigoritolerans TaxID=450367 RepID=UPI0037FDFFF3